MANFNPEIFKAYDIRGIYGDGFDEEFALELGGKISSFLNVNTLVVGRDARLSSKELAKNVIKGMGDAGTNVISLGLCSTPLFYYAVNLLGAGGGIMVTASHNPEGYGGFKIVKEGAVVIEGKILKEIFKNTEIKQLKEAKIVEKDVTEEYVSQVIKLSNIKGESEAKIVVDTGNGMSGPIVKKILEQIPIQHTPLFFDLDGTFPNRDPNPLIENSQKHIKAKIKETNSDLGVMLDGDGDRILFFDEKGNFIPADYILLLAAQSIENPKVIYDLRMSKIVPEKISLWKGTSVASRIGHTFMKQEMINNAADIGGELSGHFFFKDFYSNEAPELLFLKVIDIINREEKPISELIKPFQKYYHSGEINFELKPQADKLKILESLKQKYADGKMNELDGITIEYEDWWFNVRPSNTEPLIRLVVEANTKEMMEKKIVEISQLLKE